MENILKLVNQKLKALREAEEDKSTSEAEKELKDILKLNYSSFVKELGDNINDPKFRQAIKTAANKHPIGEPSKISPKVTNLKPTQNEIDVDKSLKFPLTNASSAASCLKGGNVSIAGKSIVTGGGGKFIIDGHHRWSQLYCVNPDASITAIDIDITNPMDGLKATQLGIAADIGKVPTAKVEGRNLLKIGEKDLKDYVIKTITPEVLEVFKKAGKGDSAEAVSEFIWKNVQQIQQDNQPVPGAPERGIMPQTDDATKWTDDAPKVDAIKEIKRLQKLAGII